MLIAATICMALVYEPDLPPELKMYLDTQLEKSMTSADIILTIFAFAAIVANIGLLFFVSWAKALFLISVIITTFGMAFSEPVVQSALETAMFEVGIIIDGAIVALIYFSNIKHEFVTSTS